ncbi:MAG: acyltransferase [Paludibacteraceae bacterium]|nr:acyltransferase [Paludibacteraceae bacterium]MBR6042528.1 acyltransferase [Paludibacteraceae bacterium]
MPEWKGKTRGGSLGYRIFIGLIKHCGLKAAYALLFIVVPYFVPFAPKSTKASWWYWRNIQHKSRLAAMWMVLKHYYRFGQIIIDKIAAPSGYEKKFKYDFNDYERFLDILNSGKGVVMIGAHFGHWALGGQFFGDYSKKINIVMFDAEYQKIKDQIEELTGSPNYKVIPVNDDEMATIFSIKGALDNGEYVCFQGDRYVNENKVLPHDLMGHPAKFPAGPFLIASRMHLPVVFYFSEKEDTYRYSFNFFFADEPKRSAGKKQEMQLLDQYVSVLEQRMKKHPEQWFNFYQFWQKQ